MQTLDQIFLNVGEEGYHAATRRGEYLSSHMLAIFRQCPALYKKKLDGLIEEKPSTAYAMGSATHKMILEGPDEFFKEYMASEGPVNPKTGAPYGKTTKAYSEWIVHQEKKVVSLEEWYQIQHLNSSVHDHPIANDLLSFGYAERTVRASLCDVPCQIRVDWFNPDEGIVDLKTCADLDWFEPDAKRYGYVYQMAFYRQVLRVALGATVPVHMIAVEKAEPYRTGVWRIPEDVLDAAENVNLMRIEALKECQKNDQWPTGFEELRYIHNF